MKKERRLNGGQKENKKPINRFLVVLESWIVLNHIIYFLKKDCSILKLLPLCGILANRYWFFKVCAYKFDIFF